MKFRLAVTALLALSGTAILPAQGPMGGVQPDVAIVKQFDTNKDGQISFDEFLRAIRGDLNQRRLNMVH